MQFLSHNLSSNYGLDFNLLANLGYVKGIQPKFVFGHNSDVDTDSFPEDLWEVGGTYVFPTSQSTVEIVSTSASDSANQPGARSVLVEGLDLNFNEITEVVSLNGLTSVTLSNTYYRINSVTVVLSGTDQSNVGTITLRISQGEQTGVILAIIPPFHGACHQAVYTVPHNKKLALTEFAGFVRRPTASETAELSLLVNYGNTNTWVNVFHLSASSSGSSSSVIRSNPVMIVLPEHSDIKLSVSYVSANNASILGMIQGYLVDDEVGQ